MKSIKKDIPTIFKFLVLILILTSCNYNSKKTLVNNTITESIDTMFVAGNTIATRFEVPEGYTRINVEKGSFGEWLRDLPLKPIGYKTHYFNKQLKHNDVSAAVIDMDIDSLDLQQCADAIIRLYAEYLFINKQYNKINFDFTNGFKCNYSKWAEGWRVNVYGNTITWYKKYDTADYSYSTFREYLKMVFMYAGTISLKNQLSEIGGYVDAYSGWEHLKVGDVLIKAGSPGHAVIIVDIIEKIGNPSDRKLLLAQSYMPAQEIEILEYWDNTCWYERGANGKELTTAEWNFIFPVASFKRFQ